MNTVSHPEIIGLDISRDWLGIHCLSDSRQLRLPNRTASRRPAEPSEPQTPSPEARGPSGGAAASLHRHRSPPVSRNLREEPIPRYFLPENNRSVLADPVKLETSLAKIDPDHASIVHVDAPFFHGWRIASSRHFQMPPEGVFTPSLFLIVEKPSKRVASHSQFIKGIAVAGRQAALGLAPLIHRPSCRFESKFAPTQMKSCSTRDPSRGLRSLAFKGFSLSPQTTFSRAKALPDTRKRLTCQIRFI